eukprot:g4716.t1
MAAASSPPQELVPEPPPPTAVPAPGLEQYAYQSEGTPYTESGQSAVLQYAVSPANAENTYVSSGNPTVSSTVASSGIPTVSPTVVSSGIPTVSPTVVSSAVSTTDDWFNVSSPDTTQVMHVTVPDGYNSGDTLPIAIGAENFTVTVPEGVRPGESFAIQVANTMTAQPVGSHYTGQVISGAYNTLPRAGEAAGPPVATEMKTSSRLKGKHKRFFGIIG